MDLKRDLEPGVVGMQAKLALATRVAQLGELQDRLHAPVCHSLDVLGFKLPNGTTCKRTRDISMQYVFPLIAKWDAFVQTRST